MSEAADVLADNPADEFFQPGNDLIDLNRFFLTDLLAREQKQILGQMTGPHACLNHGLNTSSGRIIVSHIFQRHFAIAKDSREDIVEIVGNTAGKGANGFHFL